MSDIFISYASADRERARQLSAALDRRGWSTWWDRTIPPGKEYDEVIEEALESAKCVIVLWSQASVASSWVKTEAAEAMRRKILVPALIDDVKIPLEFRRLQAADLSQWRGESAGLEQFFHSIDLKIHDIRDPVPAPAANPALPASVEPRPLIQPGRWALAGSPAAVPIVAVTAAASGLILWLALQPDKPGPNIPAQDMTPRNPALAADLGVVDQPDRNSRPPEARDSGAVDRPPIAGRSPERDAGKVVDQSDSTSRPAARELVSQKQPPVAGRASLAVEPVIPPAPAESLPTPARATNPPPAAAELPKEFEEILLIVTKEGEEEEEDAILVFDDASLVLKDEDSNILRTVPYSNIQKATYSQTQHRIMFVRTTRHWLTLDVGREAVRLQLPAAISQSILSQVEKHTGARVNR
jgi:hypothetical protein